MNIARHSLSNDSLSAFARGGGGSAGVRQLADVRLSRTMLLLRALVRRTEELHHQHAGTVRHAFHSLGEIQREAPSAVRTVLGYPSVAAWALRCATLLRNGDPRSAQPGRLTGIVAAAAIHAAVSGDIDLGPTRGGWFSLPSLGAAIFPGTGEVPLAIRTGPSGAELSAGGTSVVVPRDPYQDTTGWRGLRRIYAEHDGHRLEALLDGRLYTSLPMSPAPIPRLTDEAEVAAWQQRIAASWRLLVRHHPATAAEVGAMVQVLAPLRTTPTRLHSGTLRDAFGSVVMSLPPDDRLGAVALAHETQHAKLSVVMDVVRLVDPRSADRFYAPWRDDTRPAAALLQGLYAHLGVAGFWRQQRSVEFECDRAAYANVEFARWRAASAEAARTLLDSGALTGRGREFVAQLRAVIDDWLSEPVPSMELALAEQRAEQHRTRHFASHAE